MERVAIIGAGASGLLAGIFAKNDYNEVTILERYDVPARKILATGNGRCNYWNSNQDIDHYHSSNSSFLDWVITKENQKNLLDFLSNIGVVPFVKNGYYYPYDMKSSTIKSLIMREAKKRNINFMYNADIDNIVKDVKNFKVYFDNKYLEFDKVVIASGSNSYYKEKNKMYKMLEGLGHNIIPLLPSLVQLVSKEDISILKGIRSNVKVGILVDNILIKEEVGEILFTDYGLSGICIFNISRYASLGIYKGKKVEVTINFLYEFDDDFIEKRAKRVEHSNLVEFLEGIVNVNITNYILKGFNCRKKYQELNASEKEMFIDRLTNFKVEISSTKSFDSSQVTIGGINTEEINPQTMESDIVKDLYIVGEMLDVDGDCGGYNLGFAFLSGMIAGRSINDK